MTLTQKPHYPPAPGGPRAPPEASPGSPSGSSLCSALERWDRATMVRETVKAYTRWGGK
jgi:hypothetical protein